MYPPEVLHALKEALKSIYWYKDDLRRFLLALELPRDIVTKQGWHDQQEYKVRIVGKVLDELVGLREDAIGPMRRLIQAVLDIPDFNHLRNLEDGAAKVQNARRSVEALRPLVVKHDDSFRKKSHERKENATKVAKETNVRNEEISRLNASFIELISVQDHKKRGRLFESFLNELFTAHDLDPRGSFRIVGEQIDGAFEFDGTQFLLEAKWEKNPQGAEPVDSFSKKVERKLDNTLGLFISLEGFTEGGLRAIRGTRPNTVLMDGQQLAVVLQGLVDFRKLLKQMLRHTAQTGDPYLRVQEIGS